MTTDGATGLLRTRLGVGFGLMLVLATIAGAQQSGTRITGRVQDATEHIPIPAATVLVTGTTIGATTTDSGSFAFHVPADAKTFTVRRIGYLAKTVPISAGQTDYTIVLAKDVLRLQTQVVTGVATTVASQNNANSIAVVTTQEINEVPSPTLENSLQGKIPGAIIQNNNGGAPGGGLQMQVRGITSINGNGLPLYVVDGVLINNETVNGDENAINQSGGGLTSTGQAANGAPSNQDNGVNRIADINPDDIESIEVLKGASASAIYGSKASAGVVIITTKRGTSGKAHWNINGQVGHFAIMNVFPIRTFGTLASAQGWYVNNITGDTAADAIAADNAYIAGIYSGPQNLQRQVFGNSQLSNQFNISVSGSSGPTQYYLSGLTMYDNGTLYGTGYNKQGVRANITETFDPALSVSANLNYVHSLARRGITGNDNIGISPYNVFSYTPGFIAMNKLNPDGSWVVNPFGPANPFADAKDIQTPQATSRFIGGGALNWTPWKTDHQSFAVNLNGGADLASLNDLFYAPPYLQVEQVIPSGLPGTSVANTAQINYFNYSANLIYHNTSLSWLDATTSGGWQRDERSNVNPVSVGFNLLSGVGVPTVGTVQNNFFYHTAQKDQAFYLQEQIITLDSKLTVTAGITAERSTNDGDINKFYYYPHYSGSYRIPGANFLDEIKLRAAYGQSGNLAPYGARYSPFPPSLIAGFNSLGTNNLLGDPNIKPESEQEFETGFDATFWHSRAQFTATVYRKTLTSLLLQAGVAPSLGYTYQYINGGAFTNEGIELSLQATPVQLRNGFTWVSTTTYYRNYSVVNALPVPPFPVYGGGSFGSPYLAPGRSVSELVNTGVAPLANGLPPQVGDAAPTFSMGIGNEFTYKGWRVFGLLDWVKGGNTADITDLYYDFGPNLYADSAVRTNRLAAFNAGQIPYLQPASFLKVREVTLSYTLPASWVQKTGSAIGLTNIRLQVSGYNLWGIWSYDGLDPEVSFIGSSQNIRSAGEVTPYPPARSYYFGLNLGL